MPQKLAREDDIDNAYDYSPAAQNLSDAENNTSDSYTGSGIDQAEAFANDKANGSDVANKQESSADSTNGQWQVNRTQGASAAKNAGGGVVKLAKRGGPTAGIIGALLGLASIVSFFGGPGLLIVNFAEVLSNKFNHQVASLEVRHQKIMYAKLNNTTTGVCKSVVSIKCKYSSFSKTEIDRFKNTPGLKTNVSKQTIFGRYKIDSFEFDGKTVLAKDYAKAMKNDPGFNKAMKNAYSVKLTTTSDKKFLNTLRKFGTSKAAPFPDDVDDKARAKAIVDQTKNGQTSIADVPCEKPDACTAEEQEARDKARTGDPTNDLADEGTRSGTNRASDIIGSADDIEAAGGPSTMGSLGGTAASILKITGPFDNLCMGYGWIKTIGILSKTVRQAQMIRYGMIFMSTASQIKAGDAKPADVAYIGTLLTKIVKDSKGNLSKSATDSFGYRYAAFGDKGITMQASPYIAGASFGGKLQGAVNTIMSGLGGKSKADTTCKILANPVVQVGSIVVGVASFFFGAGEVKLSAQMLIAPVIALVGLVLPAMIADLTSGTLVDENTFGEKTGDITASGVGGMHSSSGTAGGNTIMKPEDAKSYVALNEQIMAEYADYERSTHSAFDASNPNTFMGSIYTRMAPLLTNSTSIYSTLGSVGTLVGSIGSNFISPKASAAEESFTECKDLDYIALNLAADPFCNPITGIPTKYLGITPGEVVDDLISRGYILEDGTMTEKYDEFNKICSERTVPYGTSADGEVDKTDECFIESQQDANVFIYLIDGRNNDVLENGLPDPSSGSAASTAPTGTGVSGTDQELAKMILANKNIEIAPKYKYQFVNYANGDYSCHLSPNLLKLIASLGNTYQILVYSVNRACTNSVSIPSSLHSLNGQGNAVDIARVNGVNSTGAHADDIKVYESAMAILPDKKLQLGQVNCRGAGVLKIPAGNTSRENNDSCTHIHIGIYP